LERAWAYQELHSASAAVFHGACQLQCLLAHRLAGLLVQEDGRCLLEHLLVAALDAALTLVEVDAVAVPIEKHLASKQELIASGFEAAGVSQRHAVTYTRAQPRVAGGVIGRGGG